MRKTVVLAIIHLLSKHTIFPIVSRPVKVKAATKAEKCIISKLFAKRQINADHKYTSRSI